MFKVCWLLSFYVHIRWERDVVVLPMTFMKLLIRWINTHLLKQENVISTRLGNKHWEFFIRRRYANVINCKRKYSLSTYLMLKHRIPHPQLEGFIKKWFCLQCNCYCFTYTWVSYWKRVFIFMFLQSLLETKANVYLWPLPSLFGDIETKVKVQKGNCFSFCFHFLQISRNGKIIRWLRGRIRDAMA